MLTNERMIRIMGGVLLSIVRSYSLDELQRPIAGFLLGAEPTTCISLDRRILG